MIVNLSKTEHAALALFLTDLADLLHANCSTLMALPNTPEARKLARQLIASRGEVGKPEVTGDTVAVYRGELLEHLRKKVGEPSKR